MAFGDNPFIWYELMTSDPTAAEAFYRMVAGWDAEAFPGSDVGYTIFKAGAAGAAGLMALPPEARQSGLRPCWVGYVGVKDADEASRRIAENGGRVHRQPADIPGVGRFAVIADPQGAMLNILQPHGPAMPLPAPDQTGQIGWRELYTTDLEGALAFYQDQFGWSPDDAIDMGAFGPYQLFRSAPDQPGGMMGKPPQVPSPCWLFYINVSDIDAAGQRVGSAGGQVLMGPQEVPGGSVIVQCLDPQGAMFALSGRRN